MSAPYFNPTDPNTIGSSADIQQRVLMVMPRRWWTWKATIQGWIIGGLSDSASWAYSWFVYALQQSRIATSTGPFLDIIAYDYLRRYLTRQGMSDVLFRTVIMATILQERVTRFGMIQALTNILGVAPQVIEPWHTGDCGGYGSPNVAYGRAGAWGSIALPGQVFMKLSITGLLPRGVPNATGYGGYAGGYYGSGTGTYGHIGTDAGAIEYVGSAVAQIGVTDRIIYRIIKFTRPTGVICWTRILS